MSVRSISQRPSPLGGGIIKGDQFGRYTVLPRILLGATVWRHGAEDG
ncbi:hypothetical protein [Xylella fastidiosa]|nr:hypothetical protein [Xylella fastidiosa]MDG4872836.1 hypothetical protein [Xylella fastidiosa subsp. multiplex]